MKIAYVSNSRFPSEKAQSDHVMAMCASFAALGYEVRLFVPERRPVMAEDPFVYYGKPKTFSFERVACVDGLRFRWLGPLGLWIQTATFTRNLSRRLAAFAPDVTYSRELYTFSRYVPGKHVWESHSLHAGNWAKRIMRSLDGIVTLTNASRDRILENGVEGKRVFVEPDAVDPSLFEYAPSRVDARRELGIREDETLCVYVGKFTTMGMPKGIDESIAAVSQLRRAGMPMRLLAVGATPDELVRYTEKKNEGIEFVGHQPQAGLNRFYAAADILLMPFPYTEHYAFFMSPLKMFEYMMSGVPMVVTDLPSVRDILSEREVMFARPGDAASLAEAITSIMEHPSESRARAHAAKQLSTRYTWTERATRIASWLKDV